MQSFDDPMRSYFTEIAGALSRAKGGETKSLAAASTPQPAQSLEIPSIDYQPDFHTPPSRNPALEEYARMHHDLYKPDFAPFNQPLVLIFEELTEAEKRRQNPAYAAERKETHNRYMQDTYDQYGLGKYEPLETAVTKSNNELFRAFFMPREFLAPLNASMAAVEESTDRFLKAQFESQSNRGTNSQETRPFIAPTSAAMSEEPFDFDAGRSVVNRLSGGGRIPKRDSSNKP